MTHQQIIEKAWCNDLPLSDLIVQKTIELCIENLDRGVFRIAKCLDNGTWQINDYLKKAIMLYFKTKKLNIIESGQIEYYDKIPLKQNFSKLEVRVVPPAIVRYGTFLGNGVVLMASYVNIGAYIDENTMIDIHASIGSCAQLGKNIHVSAGAVIGGVLEPIQAKPVIIEDGVFIGAGCHIVEGVHIAKEAVIGSNVTITSSTRIIDVTQENPKEYKAYVPERSIVISGTYAKQFPAGNFNVACALIIGSRTASTNAKVTLNEVLRDF